MFATPTFNEVIYPFTLRFKCPELEEHYAESVEENYQIFRWVLRIILASLTAISVAWVALGASDYFVGEIKGGVGSWIAAALILLGILIEAVVLRKAKIARTVPLSLIVLIAAAVINTSLVDDPSWRPGYSLLYVKKKK